MSAIATHQEPLPEPLETSPEVTEAKDRLLEAEVALAELQQSVASGDPTVTREQLREAQDEVFYKDLRVQGARSVVLQSAIQRLNEELDAVLKQARELRQSTDAQEAEATRLLKDALANYLATAVAADESWTELLARQQRVIDEAHRLRITEDLAPARVRRDPERQRHLKATVAVIADSFGELRPRLHGLDEHGLAKLREWSRPAASFRLGEG